MEILSLGSEMIPLNDLRKGEVDNMAQWANRHPNNGSQILPQIVVSVNQFIISDHVIKRNILK